MPKIRDLGINVIPATMRPPEIGPGGGFDLAAAPAVGYQIYLTETCQEATCPESSGQCVPSVGAPPPTCAATPPDPPHLEGGYRYDVGGLTHDAIVQLKQHLQDLIGTELQN